MPAPVLLMARELNLGGSERQLAEMAKSLDRTRFDPRAGCFRPGGLRENDLKNAGVPVVHFPVPSLASVQGAIQIAAYIRRQGIRLVHTFDTPANIYGVPVARMAGKPVVLSSQRVHRDLWPPVQHHALRMIDHLVDGIVVNCEFLRQHLRDDEKVPPGRIHLCYNGIDTAIFRPDKSPRPEPLRDASLVIGIVCSLRPEKGLSTLLDAFALVRDAAPCIKLAIVGSGPGLADLEKQARALGIGPNCHFEPGTAQVPDWLRAIDIFVLPSLAEALSNSLMEAMACGCCVVASRVGGNPELVTHGDNGLLFEAGNAAELADVLRRLIRDATVRARLAASAAHFIQTRFPLAAAARRMGEIYSSLLA